MTKPVEWFCAIACGIDAVWWWYLISWKGGMLWIAGACIAIYINRTNA